MLKICAEKEAAIAEDGWTKSAAQKMRKIDSFLKESQRLSSLGSRECPFSVELLIGLSHDSFFFLERGYKSKNTQGLDAVRWYTHSGWNSRVDCE